MSNTKKAEDKIRIKELDFDKLMKAFLAVPPKENVEIKNGLGKNGRNQGLNKLWRDWVCYRYKHVFLNSIISQSLSSSTINSNAYD